MAAANKQQLANYLSTVIPAVSRALCDPLEDVREAAATAFDRLYKNVGAKAVDDILPGAVASFVAFTYIVLAELLEALNTEEKATWALDGLRQIIAVRASAVLPFLVPRLTRPPITYVVSFLSWLTLLPQTIQLEGVEFASGSIWSLALPALGCADRFLPRRHAPACFR
jgi:hypothetical protein